MARSLSATPAPVGPHSSGGSDFMDKPLVELSAEERKKAWKEIERRVYAW